MDFSFLPSKINFDTAYDFGQNSIAPYALEWKNSLIPKKILKEAGELGFASLYVNEKDGGSGLTRLDSTLVFDFSNGLPFCFFIYIYP